MPPAAAEAGGSDRDRHRAGILFQRIHPASDPADPELVGPRRERRVQRRPAHAEAGTRPEQVVRPERSAGRGATPLVADPDERPAGRRHPEPGKGGDRSRHEPLAAGLVDRGIPRLDHRRRHARQPRLDAGGQSDRPAADDDDVNEIGGHRSSIASARFSVGMRMPSSSTAFSTVKTMAVIHAVYTSGSAMPSTTTAR